MTKHDPAPIRGATSRWIRNRTDGGWMYRGDDLWYTAAGDDDTGWVLTALRYTLQAGQRRSLAGDQAVYMRLAMVSLDDCRATVAQHQLWLTLTEAFAVVIAARQAEQASQVWRDVATVVDEPQTDDVDD